ncbi:MAG: hypothetical protein DWQ54_25385 [Microcystis flos-aquae TF09]|uniref:Transposase family protein n=1 Tax=Microcystis flos-aquae TF09 TaxID=2060473 RepID=A0A3E0KU54_9CHRO|nr:MAG: hypothetical protein DWQ54_25385 [Microcystis flos-aquae TF09]
MWINFDQLLDLPNVTVVNYQKIDETIFLKLALLNETIECPNCHQTLDRINQTEYIRPPAKVLFSYLMIA